MDGTFSEKDTYKNSAKLIMLHLKDKETIIGYTTRKCSEFSARMQVRYWIFVRVGAHNQM